MAPQPPRGSASALPSTFVGTPVDKTQVFIGVDNQNTGIKKSQKMNLDTMEKNIQPRNSLTPLQIENVAALRLVTGFVRGDSVQLIGHTRIGDGGGGPVRLQPTAAGTHDGSNNVAVLADSGEAWVADEWVGATITNTTDGSSGTVLSNTATTVAATLAGGTDNDWDTSDAYTISFGASADNNGSTFDSADGTNWYWQRVFGGSLAVTPEMFGSVSNGIADDTVPIQTAFDSGRKTVVCVGTYMASGLDLTGNGIAVQGGGTISLIDSSADDELFKVSGNDNVVRNLNLYGNKGDTTRPAQGTGSPIVVAAGATDCVLDNLRLFHARTKSPAVVGDQSNLLDLGTRTTLRNIVSKDSWGNNFDLRGDQTQHKVFDCQSLETDRVTGTHTGSSGSTTSMTDSTKSWTVNEWVGFILINTTDSDAKWLVTANTSDTLTVSLTTTGGADDDFDNGDAYTLDSPTSKALRCGGGSAADGISIVASNFHSDNTFQVDWASENNAAVVEHVVLNAAIIRSASNIAAKFAHARTVEVNGGVYQSLSDVVTQNEGMALAERLYNVAIRNAVITASPLGSTTSTHLQHTVAGNKHRSINTLTLENVVFGVPGLDPFNANWDSIAIDVRCFKLKMTQCSVNYFQLAAIVAYPDATGVVSIRTSAPPAATGSGDVYIVGAGSISGDWSGTQLHTLAWDISAGVWIFEEPSTGTDTLKYDTRVWNAGDSKWYRFLNGTDGWIEVEDGLIGYDIHDNEFVGVRASASLFAVRDDGISTQGKDRLLKRSSAIKFYSNELVNLGTGNATALTQSAYLPVFQQKSPGVWEGTAVPTVGIWSQGDIILRSDATLSATAGWMCTGAGEPGTWKAMANLAA